MKTSKKILVLGVTGMLGWMVYDFFRNNSNHRVVGTSRERKNKNLKYFNAREFIYNPKRFSFVRKFDYIINCIGIIKPYCKDDDSVGVINAIEINALFPHKLNNYCKDKINIIQIATDCVFSGAKGKYSEDSPHDALDVYGKTKSLGEVFTDNFLNIRCSIIGHELKNNLSLLEWFLSQPDNSELKGFSHHKWNGVTTLQFAKLCLTIINKNKFASLVKASPVHHFVPNTSVTKYQLLTIMKAVYGKDVSITKINDIGPKVDRTLATDHKLLSGIFEKSTIKSALIELRKYNG